MTWCESTGATWRRSPDRRQRHSRRARPRVLAGTTAGLVGIGTAVALMLSAAGSSPAFAVTRNHDGTVTVALRTFSAIRDANAKLAGAGLPAKLVQVRVGCPADAKLPPALMKAWHAHGTAQRPILVPRGVQARFDPRKIPAGKILVLATWRTGRSIHVTAARAVRGVAPACLPPPPASPGACRAVKLPPPGSPGPRGGTGTTGSGETGTTGSGGTGTGTVAQPQVPGPGGPAAHGRTWTRPSPGRAMACVAAMLHGARPPKDGPLGSASATPQTAPVPQAAPPCPAALPPRRKAARR